MNRAHFYSEAVLDEKAFRKRISNRKELEKNQLITYQASKLIQKQKEDKLNEILFPNINNKLLLLPGGKLVEDKRPDLIPFSTTINTKLKDGKLFGYQTWKEQANITKEDKKSISQLSSSAYEVIKKISLMNEKDMRKKHLLAVEMSPFLTVDNIEIRRALR